MRGRTLLAPLVCLLFAGCAAPEESADPDAPQDEQGGVPPTEDRPPGGPLQSEERTVRMHEYGFWPQEVRLNVGQEVSWRNDDPVDHTATADEGAFDTGSLAPNDTGEVVFEQAGVYEYHCSIHPEMQGVVIVE